MKLRLAVILGLTAAGLAFVFILTSGSGEAEDSSERPIMWSFDLRDLHRVEIALPQDQLAETWFHVDRVWYFDRPGRPLVDMDRWGGAVPYLLSGPGANRLIMEDAADDDLDLFGLLAPRMTIHLEHDGEHGDSAGTVVLVIGDETPDSFSFYLQLVGTGRGYPVARAGYEVMERLVVEPPYLPR
ncbi:MAG: hypothetical protein OXC29_11560 [Rhodococcus sp.]|nr:hypothetical protein [Rhodococcus sp. (in: high G+C Gram-positive bacteria)]